MNTDWKKKGFSTGGIATGLIIGGLALFGIIASGGTTTTTPVGTNPTTTVTESPKTKTPETTSTPQQATKCNIKGNISYRTGEKIYHVPGQRYYDSTKINTSAGERWFCSEAEAVAAGWRKSKV
ncbi:hypothetical protein IKL45_02565 [Candidatus Saccharibacteria bacterium]|nr:hypothetical protein [Candidatus Saccharibacteria bacterium]MBR6122040.1 hypothetical protein [Candidatus Saccharibacteria bacterium]